MLTSEQVLAKLFELRKEYDDDKDDPMYQALHHACLFLSYRIGEFKQYLEEAEAGIEKAEG